MLHLVISCSSYILFFVAKAMMPTQPSSWRLQEYGRRSERER
jgi:hypothetical protein